MKKILPLIGAAISGFIAFIIAKGLGEEMLEGLKGTGGFITASEIIEFKYVFPTAISIIAAYVAHWLIKDK